MRKTMIYVVLLAVLATGVWYFLFSDKNVFGTDEAGFTVKDTAAIQRIYLADKSGNTILLQRRDSGWYVNDAYRALQAPVNALLKTLATQEAVRPATENMHNSVIKMLAAKGIKVELYKNSDKPAKVFYVAGQAGTNEGSYMLMEGAQRPYIVQIRGFEGYLSPRYSTDFKDWRDRTVFNVPEDQFKTASIQYADLPLNSFTVNKEANGKVTVMVDKSLSDNNQLNQRRATVYTKFFDRVYCEGYLNGQPGLDSVIAAAPKRCSIDITDVKGRKYHADVYWKPVDKRSKNLDTPDPDIPEGFDSDRFYATINNGKDTVVIQRATFDKILRRGFEFYQPDEQPVKQDTIRSNSIRVNQ